MKISLNWIKDYVKIPKDLEMSRLAYDLTMSTVEVEGITELGKSFENIIVGVVNDVLVHPNADKLRICKTDIGEGDEREIVCGGTNLKVGMKVVVACPGAMVRWHGEGELVEIKKAKLRGVESYGMICASSEIGLADLFPESEEGEIVDLSGFDVQAGTNLAKALDLDDAILEIDNKSLTNRPDLWGHYGIAREISAMYDLPIKEITPFKVETNSKIKVDIENTERCARYIGAKIEGVSARPASFELRSRIWRVGIRPVNLIVDITNYVMLATGQPMHAFDADNIKGNIVVRCANDSEKMLLLDDKKISLSSEDLVIADDEGAIGLAGVMGGKKDSVLPTTQKVMLEIANFEPAGIRKTTTRHEIRTEAANRFEKGIDPQRCDMAFSLAMQMFSSTFENMSVTEFCDNYPKHFKRKEIDVSLTWLEKCLGKHISNEDIACKLKRLGFTAKFDADNMHVVVPTWRSTGDVSIPNDIMEEIARMHGFENFEPVPIITSFVGAINQTQIDMDRKIREYLAFRCGMNEIFTYPWINKRYIKALFPDDNDALMLVAPPSPDEKNIRTSLLPNICKAIAENLRFFDEFAIFESAQVYFNRDFESRYDVREKLPLQRRNIAGACVESAKDVNLLFRKAKGIIESMSRHVHIEQLTFEKVEKPVWADNVVWLNIVCGNDRIGNIALLSKKVALDCGIKNGDVMLFELDMDLLRPYASRTNKFEHVPECPMTEYDISLLFDVSTGWEEIFNAINEKKSSNGLLRDVFFVDEYKGQQVPKGKKSVTFRLIIGSNEKTLTSNEIENYANKVIKQIERVLGAERRT